MKRPLCPPSSFGLWWVLLLATPLLNSVFAASSLATASYPQSTATLIGKVSDQNNAVVAGARVTARNTATSDARITITDDRGAYQFAALPASYYTLEVSANGFRKTILESLGVEVARTIVQDFRLEVGEITQTVTVTPEAKLIEATTVSVGQVIDHRTAQVLPLNGRHFIDLGLLVPGSVTPPQNGNLSPPARGQGSFAMNTAGNREETVNYQVNGINLNDQINNIITLLPPLGSIQEFKVDNSTFSAEYGRNSGAIVNIATRQGANEIHGELFEYLRNDWLDARNFFNFTSGQPPPFKRNQFGGSIGGPIILPHFGEGEPAMSYNGRNRTFFYFTYEGLRQRQGVDVNTLVLSDLQRASATDPVIKKLIELIPAANFRDSTGASRFVGSAPVRVVVDQWAVDISHRFSARDQLHGYYAVQLDDRNEPTALGNTIPGFGDIRRGLRQIFTLNHTHIFNANTVNEARLGFNRLSFNALAKAELNPADSGIRIGIDRAGALPQINVAGGFNFGGPSLLPQGRGDTSFIASNTFTQLRGRHSIKVGGELRRFYYNNFQLDSGTFQFPSIDAFVAGNANSFSLLVGDRTASISQGALDFFAQDTFKWQQNVTFELGLRYEWNMSPTERFNRFYVFDPQNVALVNVGRDLDQVYKTNAQNLQPRVGIAWDPFKSGKTSVRAAYAIMTEQPLVNAVSNTTANPPNATPLSFAGTIRLDNAIDLARAAGISLVSIDHNYRNSYVQSWNLNVQRELWRDVAMMIGYFGSKGTHLRLARNINQPVNGIRPFPRLSSSSPVLPAEALGNIIQVEGTGNSSYNALWTTATVRLSSLQLNASYTWSKSIDYNSLTSPPTVVSVQDSYNLRNDRGLSDFDARHRFVVSGIYDLPFKGNRIMDGWHLAAIAQLQSGNPVNIITTNSTVTGIANTLRPDVNGPVEIIGEVERWFDATAFASVARFGGLGRNVIIGPGFRNVDLSVLKDTRLSEKTRLQFRAEVFDLLNRANFGQPGRIVGSQTFGQISNTRFPTGDSGSSRQLQFALKLLF